MNRISWDQYFMSVACLSAKRSKDPSTQVGACIVDSKNRILGTGYNGFPNIQNGCNDDVFPWTTESDDPANNKYFYVVHAEVNAILNSADRNLSNSTMYVTHYPCVECAKLIVQSEIKTLIYKEKNTKSNNYADGYNATKKMFSLAKINCFQYDELDVLITVMQQK